MSTLVPFSNGSRRPTILTHDDVASAESSAAQSGDRRSQPASTTRLRIDARLQSRALGQALHGVTDRHEVLGRARGDRGDRVEITATVRTKGVTGVEMEALTAVTTAALTVYDMIKAVDKHAEITDVKVLAKSGGKSGDWSV